jgi:putative DNA modification/repair radical SAM protein
MKLLQKLSILADAAKYDASCASSGAPRRVSTRDGGLGSSEGMGICHSYAPDGRCVSLLKLLLTNFCLYECSYCINRSSSNVQRARFSVAEVVNLTLDFYRRNLIEGLFLSSGVIQSPDYTMEQLVAVARSLREEHDFRGYIHLKTIPDAAPELLAAAGRYADRLSINIELPTATSLQRLAPEKDFSRIKVAMGRMKMRIDERRADRKAPRFAPAGQSTQMIIGADSTDDATILQTATTVYASYQLKRVYYSAFSPIPDASSALPLAPPPLEREHRLYQADWLMRFYGFSAAELTTSGNGTLAMLPLDIDPKLAWALRHRERFPVDINEATREELLRVPGLGTKSVAAILSSRRHARLRLADLARLRVPMTKVRPFVRTLDYMPPVRELSSENLRRNLASPSSPPSLSAQLALFA